MARMFIKNKMQQKRETYLCVHFPMLAGPFKQTRVGGGHQAVVSHFFAKISSVDSHK
jgi:hypothetical protein